MDKKTSLKKRNGTALAALSIQIDVKASKEIQLLPAGRFTAIDGRPANLEGCNCTEWVLDADNAQTLIAAAAARGNPAVIDYEHQTLWKEKNGQPAPAAGWFKTLEWREGVGLFAIDVEWTPAAALAIETSEYRFISPVINFDANTGRITKLTMAALTNYAGIDGMQQARLAALSSHFFDDEEEEQPMNELLAALLKVLGLDDKANEATALSALNAFVIKAKEQQDSVTALSAQLASAGTTTPDPAKFVPIEAVNALQTQLSALANQVNGSAVDKVVEAALAAGKLLPALEKWARDLGAKDMAALNAFIATTPQIAALAGTQTSGTKVEIDGVALSAEELDAARLLGQTPEAYAAGKKKYAK
ncbi:phage protease [Undibacterium sp. Ji83W]|uniref:phage protease n=1 Tax=Undibacterium sp. Ji83W TaxID=3413043 RepID=UPI003BF35E76